MEDARDEERGALALAYDEARALLGRYVEAANDLDTKSTGVTVLSATIIGFLLSGAAAVLANPSLSAQALDRPLGPLLLFAPASGATAALILSLLLALTTYRHEPIAVGLRAGDLESVLATRPAHVEFLRAALAAYVAGVREHQRLNGRMARDFVRAKRALLTGIVLATIASGILILLLLVG